MTTSSLIRWFTNNREIIPVDSSYQREIIAAVNLERGFDYNLIDWEIIDARFGTGETSFREAWDIATEELDVAKPKWKTAHKIYREKRKSDSEFAPSRRAYEIAREELNQAILTELKAFNISDWNLINEEKGLKNYINELNAEYGLSGYLIYRLLERAYKDGKDVADDFVDKFGYKLSTFRTYVLASERRSESAEQ
ncbi:MAG: hypothetical protein Q9M91_04400 [Candidatus Dojkabacteria bacterium]|nr:hypothetical protein [Candidatus Dojkabacteria bacterium]